jgi:hypothetical protein
MIRQYVVSAILLGIAACATSNPERPTPVAKANTPAQISNATAAEGEFYDVEVPEVPMATNISDQIDIPGEPRVVCRKERPTGSNRPRKVCRTVSGIGKTMERAAARETLKKLQRQQEALRR